VLEDFLQQHPGLKEVPAGRRGERTFSIELPKLPKGRELHVAVLVVPKMFPTAKLEVRLSTQCVLRVPHIESDGTLCFPGDVGPGAGLTPEQRIDDTLRCFIRRFVIPWGYGELDDDFRRESRTYWSLFVNSRSSKVDRVRGVFTTGGTPSAPRVIEAVLALPVGWVIAGADPAFAQRIVASLGARAGTKANATVLQVPVEYDFTPANWMKSKAEVDAFLESQVDALELRKFAGRSSAKEVFRIVIFSSPNCDYAYLMPNGTPNSKTLRKSEYVIPIREVLPLTVERLDPSWTYGRNQHLEVAIRQNKHVVVFGAGALGAHVIDQLARAGVGNITVVDPDLMESANVGRHLLGVEALELSKAACVAQHVGRANPACVLSPKPTTAQAWFARPRLSSEHDVDLFVDATGEPSVRAALEVERRARPTALLIGWMEPFVAAAHACQLTAETPWSSDGFDKLGPLQAVTWPPEVMLRQPACNSEFQAYTSAAAVHAVALVTEATIELLDGQVASSTVKSWVRGQRYLDAHHAGLAHREWATRAAPFDGLIIERPFDDE
jgi:hypothetical protein